MVTAGGAVVAFGAEVVVGTVGVLTGISMRGLGDGTGVPPAGGGPLAEPCCGRRRIGCVVLLGVCCCCARVCIGVCA